jgi:uncharacterized membrane protein (UPF0127 family)
MFACHRALVAAVSVAAGILFLSACDQLGQSGRRKAQPSITITTPRGKATIQVEIADTYSARANGLMFRQSLGASQGMIFVFPNESEHPFWMKNTYLPLDMIFINAARNVVGVVANAEPLTETSRSVGVASLYVLEVNAGFAARHEIQVGAPVAFDEIPTTAAE